MVPFLTTCVGLPAEGSNKFAMYGSFTELFISNYSMTVDQMVKVTRDCAMASDFLPFKVFDWASDHRLISNGVFSEESRDEVCKGHDSTSSESELVIFEDNLGFDESISNCKAYGGFMFVPGQSDNLPVLFKKFTDILNTPKTCGQFAWVGVRQGAEKSIWLDVNTNQSFSSIPWWLKGEPSGRHFEQCMAIRTPGK